MGWTLRPVVNSIMLDHPDLSIDDARAIYQYAAEACAAAIVINQAGPDYVHSPTEVPYIGE